MILKNPRSIFVLLLILLFAPRTLAQEVDITAALKSLETGKLSDAENSLQRLKEVNSSHPDVIFLDAVLSKNGEESIQKYSYVFEKHPKSKYADVSLFRVFTYYYSLGLYKKAESYLKRLKIDYPASPYIAAADRKIPDGEAIFSADDSSQKDSLKKKSTETAKAKLTIQAGAFLSVENANRLKELLIKDGFPSEIVNRVVGGSLLKIVTAGKFSDETEAKVALAQIESKFSLKGRIISINAQP